MKYNKDFYSKLDLDLCNLLDGLIEEYGHEEWFRERWVEYREDILSISEYERSMPSYDMNRFFQTIFTFQKPEEVSV